MKKWITTGFTIGAILVVSVGLGFGAIKLYQLVGPSQSSSGEDEAQAFVDPVEDIRQICSEVKQPSESEMYGDTSRRLSGDEREITTFTGIARVLQVDPVVLDFDTASVKPDEDNPVFDEEVRKLPTRQFVVTDSAVYGIKTGDVIRASIDHSHPKASEDKDDLSDEDKEVAVKLQNSIVIEDQEKHGIFAKNFTLYAAPADPDGMIYMASGDAYRYSKNSEKISGIEDVTHSKDSAALLVAEQLSKLTLYSKKGSTKVSEPPVYCGYAYTSEDDLSLEDNQIIQATLGY